VLGIGFAFLSQGMLWTLSPSVSVPRWVMLYGGAMSLLLSSTLRMLFPPAADQLQGASAPAAWLKLDGGLEKISPVLIRVLKVAAAVITAAILGRFIVDFFPLQAPRVLVTAAAAVALYQIGKRVQ